MLSLDFLITWRLFYKLNIFSGLSFLFVRHFCWHHLMQECVYVSWVIIRSAVFVFHSVVINEEEDAKSRIFTLSQQYLYRYPSLTQILLPHCCAVPLYIFASHGSETDQPETPAAQQCWPQSGQHQILSDSVWPPLGWEGEQVDCKNTGALISQLPASPWARWASSPWRWISWRSIWSAFFKRSPGLLRLMRN